jgi:hypothetical protein
MDPLRIGLIGYGGFGRFLHQTWEADGAARVVAVASLHDGPENVPHHDDWRDLVARADVDLVAVVSPPGTHAEMGEAVLDAGKHLLVEKPVATDLAGADRLIAARDRSGRVAAVDFMLRFNPVVEALVGWGGLGRARPARPGHGRERGSGCGAAGRPLVLGPPAVRRDPRRARRPLPRRRQRRRYGTGRRPGGIGR